MKNSSHNKIGGCSGTRYGCCPNSDVSKVNRHGTNCHNHNRRPDSRIQYIGYHPRHLYPFNREPVIHQEIIRQPIIHHEIIRQSNDSNELDIFHIFNLILVFIILIFLILMTVRFLK